MEGDGLPRVGAGGSVGTEGSSEASGTVVVASGVDASAILGQEFNWPTLEELREADEAAVELQRKADQQSQAVEDANAAAALEEAAAKPKASKKPRRPKRITAKKKYSKSKGKKRIGCITAAHANILRIRIKPFDACPSPEHTSSQAGGPRQLVARMLEQARAPVQARALEEARALEQTQTPDEARAPEQARTPEEKWTTTATATATKAQAQVQAEVQPPPL